MQLLIDTTGCVRYIYNDALDLHVLGLVAIQRASSVEPDAAGRWHVDLGSVHGPMLGPFERRRDALAAEHYWLSQHWLTGFDETNSMADPGGAPRIGSSARPGC